MRRAKIPGAEVEISDLQEAIASVTDSASKAVLESGGGAAGPNRALLAAIEANKFRQKTEDFMIRAVTLGRRAGRSGWFTDAPPELEVEWEGDSPHVLKATLER